MAERSAPLESVMRRLADDLWIADQPLRFLGLEIGARMTVVRLPGPRVFVHSPIAATQDLVREVRTIGPVTDLVAPNRFHHLFVGEWRRAFPDAAVHVAPGLARKRPDLVEAKTLGDEADPAWAGTIDQVAIAGFPFANEVVFFHRPSATLVASDLAFHFGGASPALTRTVFRAMGAYGRLAPTILERILVRDRPAFRRSLERVLEWPFERVIVAHGEVCERGGREALARGYAWALDRSDAPRLRRVDPHARRGRLYLALARFSATPLGARLSESISWKLDPILLGLTGGRVSTAGPLAVAVLETRGAKTGKPRRSATLYFHDGDHVVIVASKRGLPTHPDWFHNLRKHPDVTFGGLPFRAEVVDDEAERARLWGLADRVFPPFASYRASAAKAGRTIPIVRLASLAPTETAVHRPAVRGGDRA